MVERPKRPENGFAFIYFTQLGADRYPFYLTSVGHYRVGEGFYTKRTGRNDYQLLHTLAGSAYLIVNGVRQTLNPGSFVLLDCMPLHEYGTVGAEWQYEYIHFAGEGMRAYREILINRPRVIRPPEAMLLNVYFKMLQSRQMELNDASYAYACAVIALFLSAMVSEAARQQTELSGQVARERNGGIEPALHYMQTHYMENVTLKDLMSVTYLSKYHFCRKFKQIIGVPPYQYLTRLRMERATALIRDTNASISLIAKQCGFANTGQFIQQYAKYAGETPGAARKQASKESNAT